MWQFLSGVQEYHISAVGNKEAPKVLYLWHHCFMTPDGTCSVKLPPSAIIIDSDSMLGHLYLYQDSNASVNRNGTLCPSIGNFTKPLVVMTSEMCFKLSETKIMAMPEHCVHLMGVLLNIWKTRQKYASKYSG